MKLIKWKQSGNTLANYKKKMAEIVWSLKEERQMTIVSCREWPKYLSYISLLATSIQNAIQITDACNWITRLQGLFVVYLWTRIFTQFWLSSGSPSLSLHNVPWSCKCISTIYIYIKRRDDKYLLLFTDVLKCLLQSIK